MDLTPVTQSIAHISLDWAIFVGIAALITFDAMRSGSRRALSLSLSFPLAFVALSLASSAAYLPDISSLASMTQALLSLGLVIGISLTLYFAIGRDAHGVGGFITALLAGLAASTIAVSFWGALPLGTLWTFGPSVQAIFGESYRFFWLIGALIALMLARR